MILFNGKPKKVMGDGQAAMNATGVMINKTNIPFDDRTSLIEDLGWVARDLKP